VTADGEDVMTAQMPDKLVNRHPRVRLDGLHLYGVVRGDIQTHNGWGSGNAFTSRPTPPSRSVVCTALWRGYVATFVLEEDGRLRLTAFEHMVSFDEWETQPVDELLEGDFWLVMQPHFFADRTFIPFRDGHIVEDRAAWFTEEPFEVRMRRMRSASDGK
jgi:hypothetical protein